MKTSVHVRINIGDSTSLDWYFCLCNDASIIRARIPVKLAMSR